MKNKIKILSLLIPVVLFITPVFAFDVSELGDYNSRSMYYNSRQQTISQEKINILKTRKLNPSIECLNKQIKKNNTENVQLLLDMGINVNSNHMGETPLYIAVKHNNYELANLLIKNNAKPNEGFYSELYTAVKNKNQELAQLLLDNKAKVNYLTMVTSDSILYLALKNNMLSIAQQLVKKGAIIDEKSATLIRKKGIEF